MALGVPGDNYFNKEGGIRMNQWVDVLIATSKKGEISERVGVFFVLFWGGGVALQCTIATIHNTVFLVIKRCWWLYFTYKESGIL